MSRAEGGQATLELALCLPLAALVAAGVFEVGLVAADQVRLWHSAREAARAAAVDPDEDAVVAAARRAGLDIDAVEIRPAAEFRSQGDPVTVSLVYRPQGHVPIVGSLIDVELNASATMRIEVP